MEMERWRGHVAVVTGASAGIGAAIATKLVEHGLIVVGLARRAEKIQELSNKLADKRGKLYALKADISKEEDILKALQWVKEKFKTYSILVNNASVHYPLLICDTNSKDLKQTLDTNLFGLTILCKETIKMFVTHKIDGHIININSILGKSLPFLDMPLANLYATTKYGMTALTEVLRQEMIYLKSRAKISSISPGYVLTDLATKAGDAVEILKVQPTPLRTVDVANAVMYVLGTPPHVQVHELTIKPVGEML